MSEPTFSRQELERYSRAMQLPQFGLKAQQKLKEAIILNGFILQQMDRIYGLK